MGAVCINGVAARDMSFQSKQAGEGDLFVQAQSVRDVLNFYRW